MLTTLAKALFTTAIILAVSELSERRPRLGALLLTLPLMSILAFVMSWTKHHDLPAVSRMARETLILVPLGFPFFVPLAFAERWGLSFWSAFLIGVAAATCTILLWLRFGPAQV